VMQSVREDAGAAPLSRRVFRGQCRDDWRIESFSSLHQFREAATGSRPAGLATAGDGERGQAGDYFLDLANFPAGPGPGTFLHGLLEEVDFAGVAAERAGFLRERLRVAGFDARWAPRLATMLDDLLHTPLTPTDPTLTLAGVGGGERLSELEFYFPLAAVDPGRLADLLANATARISAPRPAGLAAPRTEGLQGMMKGYIDLVFRHGERFYLLDWKSNYLGPALEDYAVGRLPEVMAREGYCLQYLIYSVALHRYLIQRLPGYSYEAHFGGVFYLFLRGVRRQAGWDSGIFRDRPERQLIEELSVYLAGE